MTHRQTTGKQNSPNPAKIGKKAKRRQLKKGDRVVFDGAEADVVEVGPLLVLLDFPGRSVLEWVYKMDDRLATEPTTTAGAESG